MPSAAAQDRPLGELFGDLARETGALVRHEVQLAQTEITAKAKAVGKDVSLIAGGAVLAQAGVIALLAGVILVLAQFMPSWIAALLVGGVVAIVGAILVRRGVALLRKLDPVPHATVEELRQDRELVKEKL